MSKNYILEPVECEFSETIDFGNKAVITSQVLTYESLTMFDSSYVLEVSDGTVLKYAGQEDSGDATRQVYFTPDGTLSETAPETFAIVGHRDEIISSDPSVIPNVEAATLIIYSSPGTFTVSIYTETPDETPDVDPGAGLSKNVVHNDHPYNAVERIRSKLKQKAEQGDEGSSSGGSGVNFLHAESSVDGTTLIIRITDVGPFTDTDEGWNEVDAFMADLATKQTIVYATAYGGKVFHCPVIEINTADAVFRCVSTIDGYLVFSLDFDDAGSGYFTATVSK